MMNTAQIDPLYLQQSATHDMYHDMHSQPSGSLPIPSNHDYTFHNLAHAQQQFAQGQFFQAPAQHSIPQSTINQGFDPNPFSHGDLWETEFKVKVSDQNTIFYKRVNVNVLPPAGCVQRLLGLIFHQESATDAANLGNCRLVLEKPDGSTLEIHSDSDLHYIVSNEALRSSKACVRLSCLRTRRADLPNV
ncbi:hypothetical protein GUITHDRAFT_106167 [Guillardia theta CCMP2712]|uniref:Uncharacterized protein n=1 Tax=Guillardia theta (strain CCMP2712) TaxID=905079 RepID=L1JHT5_GUITC|nr:hypothetical protein GUITHDRAFT_106167 [Guillardia theta CCMP2712]EKX48088.1 hypothetical protein GUITHDRAFT_106167 [Guillardia theta CCMP2712]|eukprot:XP_005835068.1 hypothetical protein GUITHDRAFT_106167 [Guillardia theta CCMP2712]